MICAAHQTFFRRPITENELGWACGTHDKRKAYKVLVRKPEETGWKSLERINLDLDRYKQQALAHLLMNFQVPYIVENFSTVWETRRFSRMTLFHGVSYHSNSAKVYSHEIHIFNTFILLHQPYCLFTADYTQWRTQEFCLWGGSTNSVEDRGQRERGGIWGW